MSRLLALSILVSTVLTGCGGSGDSGDSGSTPTPPPAKKYTFEFVKLTLGSKSGCTVFDGLEQNFDTKYSAYNVQPKRLEVHDASGKKIDVSLKPVNGAITFTADVVPDGGYVSIIDYSGGSRIYQVLSIQKELLGDYLIRLNGDASSTCYSKDKALETISGYASILPASGTLSNQYQYETALVTTAKMANVLSFDMSAYADEQVLVKGYDSTDDSLVSYGFVTELTKLEDEKQTKLTAVDSPLDWSTEFDLNDLDSLAISIKQGSYTYPWFDAMFDKASDTKIPFPYKQEPEWLYTATGTTLNWNFHHNAGFQDTLDVSLMANIGSDVDASISNNGTSYVFSASGISSSHDLVQRSYYYTQDISTPITTLTHVMYGIPNNAGEVIIPDLDLEGGRLLPTDATSDAIAVSIIATQSRDNDTVESFMRRFQPVDPDAPSFTASEDSISLLLTPADQLKQRQNTKMRDYTIVER